MVLVSLALVIGAGCGGGLEKEKKVCAHVDKVCGGDPEPADQCAKDLRELKEPAGETYDKFLDCALGSTSCPEFAGCFVGGLGQVADRWGKQFEKGVDRMNGKGAGDDDSRSTETRSTRSTEKRSTDTRSTRTERHSRSTDDKFSDDDSTLPAECKHILDVCNTDDRMPRIQCREMVGKLRADAENLGKLSSCISSAKNCFALEKCIDDMWFSLN
jgi:hypothetical protein